MKNNLNRGILLAAIIAVVIWMIKKYMEGRKFRENYESTKEGLIAYVQQEQLNPIEVMTRINKLTDDEDFVQDAYDLAKTGNREKLEELVKSL